MKLTNYEVRFILPLLLFKDGIQQLNLKLLIESTLEEIESRKARSALQNEHCLATSNVSVFTSVMRWKLHFFVLDLQCSG